MCVCVCVWVCVALDNRHIMGMHHIFICSLSGCTIFFHIIYRRQYFRNNIVEYKICISIFSSNFSEKFLILRRIQRDMVKNVYGLYVIYLLFFSDFNGIWIFATDFGKIFKYHISWKSVQWYPCCSIRIDGGADKLTEGKTYWRMDMTSRFSQLNLKTINILTLHFIYSLIIL